MPASSQALPLRLTRQLERTDSLDGAARRIDGLLDGLLRDGRVRGLLAGEWLGHALHPLLSDLPIGAWTSSLILDGLGGSSAEDAADLLIGVGIAAVAPTALAGWAEWSETGVEERRVGLVHAAANIAAALGFAASLASRRNGRRGLGKALSLAGAGSLGLGGYLGGHLSYVRGVGGGERTGARRSQEAAT
jgi:uncharacterized membrane protein